MKTSPVWTVVPSPTKRRWYSLKSSTRLSWLLDGFHMGNYRYKRDAKARAEELMGNTAP